MAQFMKQLEGEDLMEQIVKEFRILHELSEHICNICRILARDPTCTSVLGRGLEDELTLELLGHMLCCS